jgi:hypothetical protein
LFPFDCGNKKNLKKMARDGPSRERAGWPAERLPSPGRSTAMKTSLPFLLCAAALLPACGGESADRAKLPPEELANRIEDLAVGKVEEEKSPRMAFLQEEDIGPEFRDRPSCRLHRGNRLLLIVVEGRGLARIDGRAVPLDIAAPVGPTGGFFTGEGVTVSIGRTGRFPAEAESYGRDWTAGATIGGSADKPIEKLDASWVCTR